MPHDQLLQRLVAALSEVSGLIAIALGGSRARGTARLRCRYLGAHRKQGIHAGTLVAAQARWGFAGDHPRRQI